MYTLTGPKSTQEFIKELVKIATMGKVKIIQAVQSMACGLNLLKLTKKPAKLQKILSIKENAKIKL